MAVGLDLRRLLVSAAAVAALGLAPLASLAQDTPKPAEGTQAAPPTPPPADGSGKAPDKAGEAPAPGDGRPEITLAPPEQLTLPSRSVLFITGKSTWDDADKSLSEAFNAIYAAIGKAKLQPAGSPMVEYLESGDEDFKFKAMVPVDKVPASVATKDVKVGQSPSGPVLKFVHRGSFEDLEDVYNRIDDYLVAKSLTMAKVYEEYETDPASTPPDKMVTNIYVVTE
jgi:effector-binding domain-containing protein